MKLKSIILSGVFALLFVTFASAQNNDNISIGVRGGLTIPGFTGGGSNPISTSYSTAVRFGAGVFADFKITQTFSIQPMLEYSQEGAKRKGMQTQWDASNPELAPLTAQITQLLNQVPTYAGQAPTYYYANVKTSAKLNYLMLPVLAKFGWDFGHTSPWRIYVDAGPYIGLLVSAKNTVTANGNNDLYLSFAPNGGTANLTDLTTEPGLPAAVQGLATAQQFTGTQDIKDQTHTVNWGFEGNVGLQYRIKRNKIFIEGGGNYGLMNIQKPTSPGEYGNGKNHIGSATVMVGYAYVL